MSGEVNLKATSDNAQMLKAMNDMHKQVVKLEKQLEKTTTKSKKLTAEERATAREAKKAFEEMQTPMQKHQATLTRMDAALKKKTITQAQYTAAVRKSKRELDGAGNSMRTSASAHKSAFGSSALASLGQYALGVGSVSMALAKASELWQKLDADAQAAFDQMKDAKAGMSELAGLAKTPEEAKELVDTARTAYYSGVGKSEDEAAGLHYKLKSTGLYGQREVFEELDRSGAIREVIPTVGAVGRLQSAFGEEETGDAMGLLSKLYQTSDVTQYTVPQIAEAVAEPGLFAAKLGQTDEELLSQMAAATQVMDVAKAGTGLRQLLLTMQEKDAFTGVGAEKSLLDIQAMSTGDVAYFGGKEQAATRLAEMKLDEGQIQSWQERAGRGEGMAPEALKKWHGRVEGLTAFESIMANMDTFRQQMEDIPAAEESQLARIKAKLPDVDVGLRRTRLAELAKRRMHREDYEEGTLRALSQAAMDERTARTKREEGNLWAAVERGGMETTRFLFGDEESVRQSSRGVLSGELRQEVGAPAEGTGVGDAVIATGKAYDASRWMTQPSAKASQFIGEKLGGLHGFGAGGDQQSPQAIPPVSPDRYVSPASRESQPAPGNAALEDKTDRQTQAVETGNQAIVKELQLLREDVARTRPEVVPVTPRSTPLPASDSSANTVHSE